MSQSGRYITASSGGTPIEFITGNTGGAVPPDGVGNINLLGVGDITVDGNPGTNTLTIELTGDVAIQFDADSGSAVPVLGILNILGGLNITTAAAGNTVSIRVDGTTDHAVQIGNATNSLTSIAVGTNGQVLIGATGADPAFATLTSTGGTITFTPGANSLNLEASASTPTSFTTDAGVAVPVANNLNIFGAHGINTAGAADTVTVAINNAIFLGDLALLTAGNDALTVTSGDITLSGTGVNAAGNINLPNTNAAGGQGEITFGGNRWISNFGTFNTFVGQDSGNTTLVAGNANTAIGYRSQISTTSGQTNVSVGADSLRSNTIGIGHTAVGYEALESMVSGDANTAIGLSSMQAATLSENCTAVGQNSLVNLIDGDDNIALGQNAGSTYTGSESNNLIIGNNGTLGDNNVLRIGTQGAGPAQQNQCFVAGITGVNVGSVATVVSIATGTGKLGTTTITAGTNISVTPGAGTITIAATVSPTSLTYTNVNTTPYVVLVTDQFISVDCSGGAITIQLPNAATSGQVFIIKDRTGSAATNNITVTTVGGAVNIDGATTFVMNTAYQSIEVIGNGSTYEVF